MYKNHIKKYLRLVKINVYFHNTLLRYKKWLKKGLLWKWAFEFSLGSCKGVFWMWIFGWFLRVKKRLFSKKIIIIIIIIKKKHWKYHTKMCGLLPCIPFKSVFIFFLWLKKGITRWDGLGLAIRLSQVALILTTFKRFW